MKLFKQTDDDEPDAIYGIMTLALLKKGWGRSKDKARGGGEASNLLLDEFNRAEFKQIAFIMGFLASPYKYTIDDDNFREIWYPNREDTKWIFLATMNTEDVGNEDLSIAAKSRFSMIEIKYHTPEDDSKIRRILAAIFNIDMDSKVIYYLMEIFSLTLGWKTQGDVKFEAGIRHLARVHQVFRDSIKLRAVGYDVTVFDPNSTGELEDAYQDIGEGKSKTNLFGRNIDDIGAEYVHLLDSVVKDHLINAIIDENAAAKKRNVLGNWSEKLEDSDFTNAVIEVGKMIKKEEERV